MFGQEIIQHQRSAKLCSVSREAFNEYLIAVKAFQKEKKINFVDYSILANYFWTTVHGLAVLLIDDQIQVSGKNCGLPTLLSGKKPYTLGNVQSMLAFSKSTIIKFWDVILFGVSENGDIASSLNKIKDTQ